ncbi:MAG: hypothetical protein Q8Q48_01765 [Candidatus Staskawiczbacteria bacterium]|nr:hypothetical protein [Candidatus Staskawiczbacteria bacterium]
MENEPRKPEENEQKKEIEEIPVIGESEIKKMQERIRELDAEKQRLLWEMFFGSGKFGSKKEKE